MRRIVPWLILLVAGPSLTPAASASRRIRSEAHGPTGPVVGAEGCMAGHPAPGRGARRRNRAG